MLDRAWKEAKKSIVSVCDFSIFSAFIIFRDAMSEMQHLMIDSYDGNKAFLADTDRMRSTMNRFAQRYGGAVEEPYLIPYFDGKVEEDSGLTSMALLEEGGHVAIHSFDKKGVVFVDLACWNPDLLNEREMVRQFIAGVFQTGRSDVFTRHDGGVDNLPQCFGPHYMADGRVARRPNMEKVYDFLDSLPASIGMTPISKPQVIKRNDGGMTGAVIIAESHITWQFCPVNQDAGNGSGGFNHHLDVFSCKEFDVNLLKETLRKNGIKSDKETLIARGLTFPR